MSRLTIPMIEEQIRAVLDPYVGESLPDAALEEIAQKILALLPKISEVEWGVAVSWGTDETIQRRDDELDARAVVVLINRDSTRATAKLISRLVGEWTETEETP